DHRHREIRRRVAGQLWLATAISGGLGRPGRHEPWWTDAALRRGSPGTSVHPAGGCDCEWQTTAETRAAEIRDMTQPLWCSVDSSFTRELFCLSCPAYPMFFQSSCLCDMDLSCTIVAVVNQ